MIELGIFPKCPVVLALSPNTPDLLKCFDSLLGTLISRIGLRPGIRRSLLIEQVPKGVLLSHTTLPNEGALLSLSAYEDPDLYIQAIQSNLETPNPKHGLVHLNALKGLERGGGSAGQRLYEFLVGRTTQTSFVDQLAGFLSSGLLTSAIILSQSPSTDPLLGKFGAMKKELDATAPESQGTGPHLNLVSYPSDGPLGNNPTLLLANLLCGQIDTRFLKSLNN